jgi:PiT family inorganic phosphate transporter
MEPTTIILVLAIAFGLYMAWNIGANDVANAMGTSVGSGALTIKQAVIVAAIFEFGGAFLVGGSVTNTIRKGIIDPNLYAEQPMTLALGMLAALLAAALWLQLASWKGLPVSTTHSIVGAVVGFAIVSMGASSVEWGTIGSIVASWFVSPLVGGLLAFITFALLHRLILEHDHPVRAMRRITPVFMFIVGTVLGLVLFFKGLKNLHLELTLVQTVGLAGVIGVIGAIGTGLWLQKEHGGTESKEQQIDHVERVYGLLQVITACFMAFAHGSNDVANAIGPLAGIVAIVDSGAVVMQAAVPTWLLTLGGVGIVVGLATYGARVIKTVGSKITEVTPTRGFSAEFGAALTILVGSRLGLPLSTTHVLVGSVIGVGFARGMGALNVGVIRNVVLSWFVTVPVGAILSALIYGVLSLLF